MPILDRVTAITEAIGGSRDVAAVLRAVGETARETLGVDRVHIFLGSDPRALTVAHLSGLPHPELSEGQQIDLIEAGSRLQRMAVEQHTLLSVDDWRQDERVNKRLAERWGIAAAIVAPLLAGERVLGLLALTRVAPHPWSAQEIDVVEVLAAQAAVALENARLFEDAKHAYRELQEAQQRMLANERLAAVGTFASGLAHEVRNPLNSMALQLSLLERRINALASPATGEMQELIGIIREEIRRLDALVGDFLLFVRTNKLQFRPASLDVIVDEVIKLLRPEARTSGVTIKRRRAAQPLPSLPMDGEKMKQVFINLLRNAIEAMPDGGVVVAESGCDERRASITIRDNGPGWPEGVDVFQLFVSTKPGGTGLGLSIAQQITLDHGGEIHIESASKPGAAITVALPYAQAGANSAAEASDQAMG
ncbi:MAG: GAF domain-containing protein [Vicinamibacteria bacterium]|jgi:signal transduction histidine kinase|nr:GAF domain-containing protein [Vicinamibacteria bacterium]